jgi:hypothetical protein
MPGQFINNTAIHVSYAYKKEGQKGERHGSLAGLWTLFAELANGKTRMNL